MRAIEYQSAEFLATNQRIKTALDRFSHALGFTNPTEISNIVHVAKNPLQAIQKIGSESEVTKPQHRSSSENHREPPIMNSQKKLKNSSENTIVNNLNEFSLLNYTEKTKEKKTAKLADLRIPYFKEGTNTKTQKRKECLNDIADKMLKKEIEKRKKEEEVECFLEIEADVDHGLVKSSSASCEKPGVSDENKEEIMEANENNKNSQDVQNLVESSELKKACDPEAEKQPKLAKEKNVIAQNEEEEEISENSKSESKNDDKSVNSN